MRALPRTTAAVSVAGLFAGTAIALSAAPASAATDRVAPKVLAQGISTNVAVISAKGHDTVKVTARVTDNVGVSEVWAPLYRKGELLEVEGQPVIIPLRRVAGTAKDGVWEQRFWPTRGDDAGLLSVGLLAFDKAGNHSANAYAGRFRVKYASRITGLQFAPKAPKAGERVSVSGKLQRVGATKWEPLAGQRVALQFRKAGTSAWTRVGKKVTAADGSFTLGKKVSQSGSWRVVFAGDARDTATTSKVRNLTVR